MAHVHQHEEGHHHHASGSRNLRIAFFFNVAFTLIEIAGGIWTTSLAVISDSLHDLGDCLVLGAAWYLSHLSQRGRDDRYSYGYGRYNMLGGWLTALVLAIGSLVLMGFTLSRINEEHAPHAIGMMLLAVFGLVMNGIAAWTVHGGNTLNERGAFLHLMEDVLGWTAVLIGAVIIHFTGIGWVDPLLSIGINLFILYNAVRTLRKGTGILMQRLPEGFDETAVTRALHAVPNVLGSHDQHAWSLDGNYIVLTVHLLVDTTDAAVRSIITRDARQALTELGVHHATIELELPGDECSLKHH